MDTATNLHQDIILHGVIEINPEVNTETPHQDSQTTCTRNSPCLQQGCLICSTPTNHVRDLDVSPTNHVRNLNVSLNNINEQPNSANTITSPPAAKPKPPSDHPIVRLTVTLQEAIQENDMLELECLIELSALAFSSDPEFATYDRSALRTARNHAKQIFYSYSATLAPPVHLPSAISNSTPDPTLNPGEEGLNTPDPSLNPEEKGLDSSDLTLNPRAEGLNSSDLNLNPE